MAIFYTDIAAAQLQGVNFPGTPGIAQIGQPPTTQNRSQLEGPPCATSTYVWAGTEAAGDIINLNILPAGTLVDATGRVCSGIVAPATTLTVAIGDNDMGLVSALPIPNLAAAVSTVGLPDTLQAPLWVSGTAYVAGNVVIDAASTPANQTFTCFLAVSGSTAPSSDTTHWIANQRRYSTSISIAAANGNVLWTGGTQLYGGPPFAGTTGTLPTGYTTLQAVSQPYITRNDCWAQATILTAATVVAGTVSVFRVPMISVN